MQSKDRLDALLAAEKKAEALFDAIESTGSITPGRSERAVEQDIYAMSERPFGVTEHWHKRIVRSGPNTLRIAADNPPMRDIDDDDIVFTDLGPIFDEWEADVGRTYVLGGNPLKQRLCRDLPRMFDDFKEYFDAHPDITGAELYAFAQRSAEEAG